MPRTPQVPSEVSANNPCPFLRALVAQGLLPGHQASIADVTKVIVGVAKAGDGEPDLPPGAIRAIALIANGLGPLQLARNGVGGLRLDELRGGPLDKKGAGSGILDRQAKIDQAQLDRLDEFARDKLDAGGQAERGLDRDDIERMMNANFDRAEGRRRRIDRRLMDGEWPILLQVMGKPGRAGRYLSVAEVRELFAERRLPERMLKRLGQKG
jgi:hypothetical protein